ncbi:MAG: hypothetical protein ACYC47_07845 [Desulfobacteria bacterium]
MTIVVQEFDARRERRFPAKEFDRVGDAGEVRGNEEETMCDAFATKGKSLLFQDDPQFLGGRLRVFPFRNLHKAALVVFPRSGLPPLLQAAQENLRSVFNLVDREQSRQFAGLLSSFFPASSPPNGKDSKIDALRPIC